MAHRYLPHTADLRAEVTAADAAGLYQSGADLLREVFVGSSPVAAAEARVLDLRAAGSDEERFFDFLRELLFLYETEGFLAAVVELGPPLRVLGERFDPARHVPERQVKAVTRHGYRLTRDGDRLRAEILFDL